MKATELRSKTKEELLGSLLELAREQFNLRM
jgi:ribosomal protein L29